MDISRRSAVKTLGMGAIAMTALDEATAQSPKTATAPVLAGAYQPVPLKFDPAKLDGLSERLIKSRWENIMSARSRR